MKSLIRFTSAIALALSLAACSGFNAEDQHLAPKLTPENGPQPQKETAQCDDVVKAIQSSGIEKAKPALDKIVSEISDQDLNTLIMGAKVYRRANPSKYSEEEIKTALDGSVEVLNKIGQAFQTQDFVASAPQIEVSPGMMMGSSIGYPNPPQERQGDNVSLADQYDGIPGFGIAVGSDPVDAGFTALSEVGTKIGDIRYKVKLIFSAVTSTYILDGSAYFTKDLKSVPFDIKACRMDSRLQPLLKLPREQADMTECEFGGCKKL